MGFGRGPDQDTEMPCVNVMCMEENSLNQINKDESQTACGEVVRYCKT